MEITKRAERISCASDAGYAATRRRRNARKGGRRA